MTGTASSPPVASRTVVTLVSILASSLSSAASAVEGKARRQSSAIARIKYLTRIFIASTPVLLGPADLLKAGGRLLCVGVSRGTRERRSPLGSRSATAKVGFGNRAILIIPRPLALRPCLTTGLPLSFESAVSAPRARKLSTSRRIGKGSVSIVANSPPGGRSDRPRRCGAIRRGRSASQPGSWRRSTDESARTPCNDAAPQNLSRGSGRRAFLFRAASVRYRAGDRLR